jgi:hypothetical protein
MTVERRQFTRIHFQANARLRLPDSEFEVEVVDLSLKGALVRPRTDIFAPVGCNGLLEIGLGDTGTAIAMEVTVVHRESDYYGLACREIDLDSITHLRRLVELNVGDESVLNRELTALAHL